MERLALSDLKLEAPLARPLFHPSGEVLLEAGMVLTSDILRILEGADIETALRPEPGEDPGEFIHGARNLAMGVNDLNVGKRMTQPVFDRGGALLVEAGVVVTERLASGLRRRGVSRIYVRRSTRDLRLDQVQAFRRALCRMSTGRPALIREEIDAARRIKNEDCTPRRIDEIIDAGGEIKPPPGGDPFRGELKPHHPMEVRAREVKDGFMAMYQGAIASTAAVFRAFRDDREIDDESVGSLTREVVGGLVEDHDLLLNLANLKTDYNYLLGHSLGDTVLSVSVAAALGYDRKLVLEMAYAAYLHDVGMLRVPAEIVGKAGNLTGMEMMQVRRHPVYSLDMLQRLVGCRSGLARSIPVVAYQSHERENGSGYPKGRKGRVIHDFAKILGVCDTYHAMISSRPWRTPMLPYAAMEQLVVMAARRVLAPEAVKGLLRSVSLFPIGSWVELADGVRARVVASSGEDYTRPVVNALFRGGERLDRPQRIDLAGERDLAIVRPIPAPEGILDLMEGF